MSIEYAIIVKNKTRLESLTERFNTRSQAQFYIERSGGSFDDYVLEHDTFHDALQQLQSSLTGILKYKIIERSFVPSFLFSEQHLIIVIGQDGLVANVAKYANGIPIIAVNPDPDRYDGVLLPFKITTAAKGCKQVLKATYPSRKIKMAEARLRDGQHLLAFNDLYIGASSHISSRYKITFDQRSEEHSSSGLIISTIAGSTGWYSSVINMATGIQKAFGTSEDSVETPSLHDELLFAVREPFRSIRTQTDIVAGVISHNNRLQIESLMPQKGVIFSDGIESDFLQFNSGAIATIGPSTSHALLVQPH